MTAEEPRLPSRVRFYIGFLFLLGAVALGQAAVGWSSPDLFKFGGFLAIAILSCGIRFTVPAVASPLSLTPLFALFGVVELTASETVILTSTVALVQCFWNQQRRPGLDQIAFNIATMALAAATATWIYHSPWMLANHAQEELRLALAATAFFVLHTVPVVLAVSMAEEISAWSVWREGYFWSLPYYLGGAAVAQLASFAVHLAGWPTVLLTGPVLYLVFRSYRLYMARVDNERDHLEAVSALHLRTIEALALAIEAKDDTTHDHLARVQVYARELARELGLTAEEQQALQAASILHDIGKLAVPEHIISKPGRLTPEEFDKMKIHPIVGAEILERVQFPYPVVPIVRAHHEKWDGSGYPHGLKGEDIPIGARILAAVDCLDALASDRQYRRALPLDEAMKVVQKESGTSFDPRVVEALSKNYVALEKKAKAPRNHDAAKLSKDIKVERGLAPAAGFEAAAPNTSSATPGAPGAQRADFLSMIGAARQEVQALFEISQDLGNSLSLDETLSLLGVRLRRIVPHHGLAIWVQRGGILMPEFVSGDDFRLFSSSADSRRPRIVRLGGGKPESNSQRKPIGRVRIFERSHQVFSAALRACGAARRQRRRGGRADAVSFRPRRLHQRSPAHSAGDQRQDRAVHRKRPALPAGRDFRHHRLSHRIAECALLVPATGCRVVAQPPQQPPDDGFDDGSRRLQTSQRPLSATWKATAFYAPSAPD